MQYVVGAPIERPDVVVLGSGASGLGTAAVAARLGRRVLVLEKGEYLGGTSAVSGGQIWVPVSGQAAERGVEDSAERALEYLEAVARGRSRRELLTAVIASGDEMLRFFEDELGIGFKVLTDFPDYRQDLPGAIPGGRTLEPRVYDASGLGGLMSRVLNDGRAPFTMEEYEQWRAFTRFPWDELADRERRGITAKGRALVAMLLSACIETGVSIATGARALALQEDDDVVTGVHLEDGTRIEADAVVIATGGFEWDLPLTDSLVASRVYARCSPPTNTGDGLRMAQRVGAMTRGTREAWWAPMSYTGDTRLGEPVGTLLRFERQGPGSIMVNRHGVRFANESQNYNDLARALQSWDSPNSRPLNTPAHVVFDQGYLERYGILAHRAGQPTPPYLVEAPTLAALAERIGVPSDALEATVERFNGFAREGVDRDFHRGESGYDRYWGDEENPWPNHSLWPLEQGPYYAMEVVNGVFGTGGGIATDGEGRVLDVDARVIPGLYAVGNATESPYAPGYPGGGATLGPILTLAYLIGRSAGA